MKQDDKHLYGLAPSDFTIEQIKKIPSYILWNKVKEDVRFEDELLSRIKSITDIRNEIELYSYVYEDITASPRLVQLVNELVRKETSCNIIWPYFNVLVDANKKYVMDLFLETGRNGLVYEKFLNIITQKYKYIDPSNKHLIKIIFELLEEKRPHWLVVHLIGHLSQELFNEIYPILKKRAPNSVMGCLLYHVSNLPSEDHLLVLKAMSKLKALYSIKDKQFKTKISPLLLKELSLTARLNVLKDISILQTYPFTHKISMGFIKSLLFPLVFRRSTEVDIVLKNWENMDKKIPTELPECDFSSNIV